MEIVSPVSEGQAPRIENSERLSPSDLLRAYADATGMAGESLQCGLQLLQVRVRARGAYDSGRQTVRRVFYEILVVIIVRAASVISAHALLAVSCKLVAQISIISPVLDSL